MSLVPFLSGAWTNGRHVEMLLGLVAVSDEADGVEG